MITSKIKGLESDIRRFESAGASVQMSSTEQDIIKKLFHLPIESKNDSSVVAGAEGLLVFGQFEKALNEFNELLKEDSMKVPAAKNILRCHLGLCSIDTAVPGLKCYVLIPEFCTEIAINANPV
ncbi:MAG: hypothetical protein ABII68_04310 [Pseudomonadota bacterium]